MKMNLRRHLRPYVTTGVAIVGTSVLLVSPPAIPTAFAANKLDPAVGQRYRQTVLANGSQRPPQQLVRDFLGRDFNAKAFFDDLKR